MLNNMEKNTFRSAAKFLLFPSLTFIVLLLIVPVNEVSADVIYLKNGRTLKGKVLKKSAAGITLEMGSGMTININSADIAETESSKETYPSVSQQASPALKKLQKSLKNLKIAKSKARLEKNKSKRENKNVKKIKKSLDKKIAEFESISKKLKKAKPDTIGYNQYNALVAKANGIKTEAEALQLKLTREENKSGDNPALSDYFNKFTEFQKQLQDKSGSSNLSKNDRAVLGELKAQFKEFQEDFSSTVIQAAGVKGRNMILNVTINDKATGRFILDTGATHTVFSQALASRLGLNLSGIKQVKSVLADGRYVFFTPVTLNTVAVGAAVEKNVEALVMPEPPGNGVDGLLGMTFLGNYMIQLNPKQNTVILNKLRNLFLLQ